MLSQLNFPVEMLANAESPRFNARELGSGGPEAGCAKPSSKPTTATPPGSQSAKLGVSLLYPFLLSVLPALLAPTLETKAVTRRQSGKFNIQEHVMAGRGPQSFKKRQKEQLRKE